eukprot:6150159-Prymnesium_polylepis.1
MTLLYTMCTNYSRNEPPGLAPARPVFRTPALPPRPRGAPWSRFDRAEPPSLLRLNGRRSRGRAPTPAPRTRRPYWACLVGNEIHAKRIRGVS